MLHNDAVDLISQEDVVHQSYASLNVPLGVRYDGVAPLLTRVHVGTGLEAGVAVAEGGQTGGCRVPGGQEKWAELG